MNPLALMIRPHGSSPHHSLALVLALTAIRASKPFPLVHITSSAPSMLIDLAAKTPYRIASFRPRPADRRTGRPSSSARRHARDLVGERHRSQIELVFDRLA